MHSRWKALARAVGAAAAITGIIACGGGSDGAGPDASAGASSGHGSSGSSGASSGGVASNGSSSGGASGAGTSSGTGSGDTAGDDGGDAGGGATDDATVGSDGGSPDGSSTGASPEAGVAAGGCDQTLPALSDYSMNGPFTAGSPNTSTGPGNGYTVVAPTTLGSLNGAPFKHPIVTWGNGIGTTPSSYSAWLNLMATHGFVVIASNSSTDTGQDLSGGLDWMIQQNTTSGPYKGVLDTQCLFTMGHSLGGISAINAGSHPNVAATVVLHSGAVGGSEDAGSLTVAPWALKGPLFIFISDTDGLCPPETCVKPVLADSDVQSFVADLTGSNNDGHLIPLSSPQTEMPGAMAWLRFWAYGDQGAKPFFWGSNATLCASPWACQSKQAGGTTQTSGF